MIQSRMDNPETQVTLGTQDTGLNTTRWAARNPPPSGMNPGAQEV